MSETSKRREAKKYRAHGFGSLEKRGKMYVARWMVNGKRFTRSTGEHEISKAREKLAEFTKPYRIGNEIDALQAHEVKIKGRQAELQALVDERASLRIDQLFGVYKTLPECYGLGATHVRNYESILRDFAKWIEENRPNMVEARKVSRMAAREYADYLTKNRAISTRNVYISLLRRVWRTIMKKENMEREEGAAEMLRILEDDQPRARFDFNPWDDIERLSLVGREHSRRELTVEELKRVCGYVTGEMRTLFAIGIYTGMRLGDCVQLDWSEVDMIRRRISLVPRKTRKKSGMEVVIPIHNVLYDVLSETPEKKRRGAVMPECAKEYQESGAFHLKIKSIFKACGIETAWRGDDGKRARCDVGFHSLRHTFVSMAANAGASLELVRKIVGHTSRAMTRHYFHEDEAALRDTVAQLPDITGGGVLDVSGDVVAVDRSGPQMSENVARVCEDVRRFSVLERAEIVKAAIAGLSAEDLKEIRAALNFAQGERREDRPALAMSDKVEVIEK